MNMEIGVELKCYHLTHQNTQHWQCALIGLMTKPYQSALDVESHLTFFVENITVENVDIYFARLAVLQRYLCLVLATHLHNLSVRLAFMTILITINVNFTV